RPLAPFGLLLTAKRPGDEMRSIEARELRRMVDAHRVVVLRGFDALACDALPDFCRGLGELLEWDFGTVNELRVHTDAQNYLFTNRAVPFHWDGAFAGRVPRYIFFQCEIAPPRGTGGETLFTDTTLILRQATAQQRALWQRIRITYTTEKIAHYGGTFTSPLVARHPLSGEALMRFAEPVADLNPVTLRIEGLAESEQQGFLKELHETLNDARFCYRHEWTGGDILIADNHALLHGRRAFAQDASRPQSRLIRRVNIL
ncbi:MAG TPA: TauD/TfdA family dioxygenase, partial [Pyrinomonadaceae bacterium]|nr:TauD/TfdA family dioxygenase [Pyrinomonadaceae bacterium]